MSRKYRIVIFAPIFGFRFFNTLRSVKCASNINNSRFAIKYLEPIIHQYVLWFDTAQLIVKWMVLLVSCYADEVIGFKSNKLAQLSQRFLRFPIETTRKPTRAGLWPLFKLPHLVFVILVSGIIEVAFYPQETEHELRRQNRKHSSILDFQSVAAFICRWCLLLIPKATVAVTEDRSANQCMRVAMKDQWEFLELSISRYLRLPCPNEYSGIATNQ